MLAPNAQADSTTVDAIGFTGPTPLLFPTAGNFSYDNTTNQFTEFIIGWDGLLFNLASAANNPLISGGGPPCIGGATGPQASFALMTNCLPDATDSVTWAASMVPGPSGESCFDFSAENSVTGGEITIKDCMPETAVGRPGAMSGGNFSSFNPFLPVPEPKTLGLMLLGIGLLFAMRNVSSRA